MGSRLKFFFPERWPETITTVTTTDRDEELNNMALIPLVIIVNHQGVLGEVHLFRHEGTCK
jgi:hypothetical protein